MSSRVCEVGLPSLKQQNASKSILFATIGSLGDLHPCLALAVELKRRGHRVTIASSSFYRSIIEGQGLSFHPMRPNWDPTDPDLIRQCEDLKHGPEILYRRLVLPHLEDTFQDLLGIASTADLMIAGELVYAAPLVSEKLQLPWVSAILSPFSFFSSHDPSVMVNAPALIHLRKAGWPIYKAGLTIGRMATRHWSNPVRQLRKKSGLRTSCDPVFRDKFSPNLVLALFSKWLANRQRDWPTQTVQPGFVHFDRQAPKADGANQLDDFLASGGAPIVFTQGSTAVHNPGDFYAVSLAAAKRVGRRAVLIGMPGPSIATPDALSLPYADYSQVFPHAAVNVHQGGSGTIGQALRSSRPMIVVPDGWDQPDNATRAQKLGVGLHVRRVDYSVNSATDALRKLLENPAFASRAAEVGRNVKAEYGLNLACDSIESVPTFGNSAVAASSDSKDANTTGKRITR